MLLSHNFFFLINFIACECTSTCYHIFAWKNQIKFLLNLFFQKASITTTSSSTRFWNRRNCKRSGSRRPSWKWTKTTTPISFIRSSSTLISTALNYPKGTTRKMRWEGSTGTLRSIRSGVCTTSSWRMRESLCRGIWSRWKPWKKEGKFNNIGSFW